MRYENVAVVAHAYRIHDQLAEYSKQGYELVAVVTGPPEDHFYTMFFKRPITFEDWQKDQ